VDLQLENLALGHQIVALQRSLKKRTKLTSMDRLLNQGAVMISHDNQECEARQSGVFGVVGLRVSEVIGLRWSECDFDSGEIHLNRGIVRQHQTERNGSKPEASTDGRRTC